MVLPDHKVMVENKDYKVAHAQWVAIKDHKALQVHLVFLIMKIWKVNQDFKVGLVLWDQKVMLEIKDTR